MRSTISDRYGHAYVIGEPAGPAEVGQLYRLFLKAGFPKTISEADRYYVATDEAEQIIGGVVYRDLDEEAVFLDGIVVTPGPQRARHRGGHPGGFLHAHGRARLRHVKTHFFLRRFYQKHGFRIDERWGGLVRLL